MWSSVKRGQDKMAKIHPLPDPTDEDGAKIHPLPDPTDEDGASSCTEIMALFISATLCPLEEAREVLSGESVRRMLQAEIVRRQAGSSGGIQAMTSPKLDYDLLQKIAVSAPANGKGELEPAVIGDDLTDNETVMDETKRQLEDLQVRTVYTLVEDVTIEADGVSTMAKVLCLTNKQALDFELKDVEKFMHAFDITPTPKLVITLMPSYAEAPHCTYFSSHWTTLSEGFGNHCQHGEMDTHALRDTDRRLAMFLKECIIPVAIQTNAVILAHTSACSLSVALSHICAAEASKRNGKLPFNVIMFSWAVEVAAAASVNGSVANQMRTQSKRWSDMKQLEKISAAAKETWGRFTSHRPSSRFDLLKACTHYVIADGVTKGKFSETELFNFRSSFTQRLSEELPSIGIAGLAMGSHDRLLVLADYANRGLPLLLLNTRPHSILGVPNTVNEAIELHKQFQEKLEQANSSEILSTSLFAFFHETLKHLVGQHSQTEHSNGEWIWEALDKEYELEQETTTDSLRTHAPHEGFDHEKAVKELVKAIEDHWKQAGQLHLKKRKDKLDKILKQIELCMTVEDLHSLLFKAAIQWQFEYDHCSHGELLLNELANIPGFNRIQVDQRLSPVDGIDAFIETVGINKDAIDGIFIDFQQIKNMVHDALSKWQTSDVTWDSNTYLSFKGWDLQSYIAAHSLLSSPHVYSGNLDDIKTLQSQVLRVAKIDRLPQSNSPEAVQILQSAWDSVDIFTATARTCKIAAKTCYSLLLILGVMITILTVVRFNYPEWLDEWNFRLLIILLSITTSAIASAVAFLNPAKRWLQLRGAASAMESEIWKFRTRTGPYAVARRNTAHGHNLVGTEEEHLREFCNELKEHVLKSAGVTRSSFFSHFKILSSNAVDHTKFTHGQYRDARTDGGVEGNAIECVNDHQTPINPSEYKELRVLPLVQFYQRRLPRYFWTSTIGETAQVVGALSGMLFVFLNIESWTVVATSITAVIMGWLEFSSTHKKLERYSDTLHQIGEIVLWWDSLADVDRANLAHVNQFVNSCETLFQVERQAWVSTSMANKLLTKKVTQSLTSESSHVSFNSSTPNQNANQTAK